MRAGWASGKGLVLLAAGVFLASALIGESLSTAISGAALLGVLLFVRSRVAARATVNAAAPALTA